MASKRNSTDTKRVNTSTDTNPDPITGAPGSHPVGVGAGAAGGAAAGAGIGAAVGGPVGAVIGGTVGAVAGGLGGKAVAEQIDPTAEHAYWRSEYNRRPYVARGGSYDDYSPAYQYGWESYSRYSADGRTFDQVESDLRRDWDSRRGTSRLAWDDARAAARDAWDRVAGRSRRT